MTETIALSHLTFPANDPWSLKRWYCENLGFTAHADQLRNNGTVLTIIKGTPLPNDDWHFGFRLTSKLSLLNWLERLRTKGIEAEGPTGDEHFQSFHIRDPEGNHVEFFFEDSLP